MPEGKKKNKVQAIKVNVGWTTAKHICNECNTPIFDNYKYCAGCGKGIVRNDKNNE